MHLYHRHWRYICCRVCIGADSLIVNLPSHEIVEIKEMDVMSPVLPTLTAILMASISKNLWT